MNNKGKIIAVCISDRKGVIKDNVGKATLIENYGFKGDAHAGSHNRQVSLLSREIYDSIKSDGIDLDCGGFAENITTLGIDLSKLKIGGRVKINQSILEVTQIGKECNTPCNIHKKHGKCVLPDKGIFAKVLVGGNIEIGDSIEVV